MSQAAIEPLKGVPEVGVMVTARFVEGLSWLHARVGRRRPAHRTTGDYRTYARIRVASSPEAMQPTVYLPTAAAATP